MKIFPLTHHVIGKLVLIGLLFSPFALTPVWAAELVGKPVPVGAQAANAAQAVSEAPEVQASAAATSDAPAAPIAPSDPAPAEAPVAAEFGAHNGTPQAMEEIRKAIDELRETIQRETLHREESSDFGVSLGADVIVPVVAMLLLFGGPILLLIVLAVLHYRAKARRQQNINMNIDKLLAEGRDIPLEMLLGEEAAVMKPRVPVRQGVVLSGPRDDNTLQKGLRNIGLGTGWLLFLTIMFNIKIGSFGFIFIGLGISQLIIWKLSSANINANVNASVSPSPSAETPESFKAQD
jgi:hypothetical protein